MVPNSYYCMSLIKVKLSLAPLNLFPKLFAGYLRNTFLHRWSSCGMFPVHFLWNAWLVSVAFFFIYKLCKHMLLRLRYGFHIQAGIGGSDTLLQKLADNLTQSRECLDQFSWHVYHWKCWKNHPNNFFALNFLLVISPRLWIEFSVSPLKLGEGGGGILLCGIMKLRFCIIGSSVCPHHVR